MPNEYLQKLFSLEGRTAVVLGGTSGIGQAIARGYRSAGANVVATSRDKAKVDAMADEFEGAGSRTLRITSDVNSRESLQALCDATIEAFGTVEFRFVTSGMLNKATSTDISDEDWERVMDANLNGSFKANQIFGRQMLKQKNGSIINTCSMTTFVTFNEVTPYAASKAGVGMLTKQLATEWAKENVRVNAIAPGVFRTPLNSAALDIPERAGAILGRTPMGRFGHVDELVGTALLLASSAGSFITGQIIAVDGGFLAKGI
ncbi:MAG TPA: SDR family oxidoreductase [Bryobacteraceae bacterium]|nr:SDR family oxidoreductase [Bryobacteraceae bacterium]